MQPVPSNFRSPENNLSLSGAALTSVQDWFQRMSLMVSPDRTLKVFDAKVQQFIAPEDITDVGDPQIRFSAAFRDRARSMYDLSVIVMRSSTERISLTLENLALDAQLLEAGQTERTTSQRLSNGGTLTFPGLISDRVYKFSPPPPEQIFKHATLPQPPRPPEIEQRAALQEPREEYPDFREVRLPNRRAAS